MHAPTVNTLNKYINQRYETMKNEIVGKIKLYRNAMARCSQLWNYLNRSANKASESVRPIARALDKLQGDKQILMAGLIPTIIEAHFQLSKLEIREDIKFCKGLISIMLQSLKSRFAHVFEWESSKEQSFPFVMATISSPKMKMKSIDHIDSLRSAHNKTIATNWLIDEAQ